MRAMGVVAASAIAFMAEEFLNAREWITIVPEARGVSAVIVGAGAAVAVVFFRGGTLADLGFKRPERWSLVPLHVIATLFAFITMQNHCAGRRAVVPHSPGAGLSRYESLAGNLGAALSMMLLLPLTASIPEEVIYRGFLLAERHPSGTALAFCLQGLMFGAVHFQWGPGGMLVATTMGMVWGTAYVLCNRNIWVVILAHSAGHMLGVLQLYIGKTIII